MAENGKVVKVVGKVFLMIKMDRVHGFTNAPSL